MEAATATAPSGATSPTPAKDAAAEKQQPIAQAAPSEVVEYAVFEVLDGDASKDKLGGSGIDPLDEVLIRHATVTVPASGGRPAAIAKAIEKSAMLRTRIEAGEEIPLLPITARLVKPERVKVKVERSLQIGSGS